MAAFTVFTLHWQRLPTTAVLDKSYPDNTLDCKHWWMHLVPCLHSSAQFTWLVLTNPLNRAHI